MENTAMRMREITNDPEAAMFKMREKFLKIIDEELDKQIENQRNNYKGKYFSRFYPDIMDIMFKVRDELNLGDSFFAFDDSIQNFSMLVAEVLAANGFNLDYEEYEQKDSDEPGLRMCAFWRSHVDDLSVINVPFPDMAWSGKADGSDEGWHFLNNDDPDDIDLFTY